MSEARETLASLCDDAIREVTRQWNLNRVEDARSNGQIAADALLAHGFVVPLSEWKCPNCGATTRARMSDRPGTIAPVAHHRNGCRGCEHDEAAYPPCWTAEQVDEDQRRMRGNRDR